MEKVKTKEINLVNNITTKELEKHAKNWGFGGISKEDLFIACNLMNTLSWPSTLDYQHRFLYTIENFINKCYLTHYKENLKDKTILDIGGSVGDFTLSVMNDNPKISYIIEPMSEEIRCILLNLKDYDNVKIIPHFIGEGGIKFSEIINKWNLSNIDFMKCDCEGGERDIFTKENLEWVIKNVKFITGEYHIIQETFINEINQSTIRNINAFKEFRDLYFNYPGIEVIIEDRDGNDITKHIWSDDGINQFVNWYKNSWRGQFMFNLINHNLAIS